MSRVFVIQVPARRDPVSGDWLEKYDLSPAGLFGELVRVLPYGNVPIDPAPTRRRLYEAFKDFSLLNDYVLLLGDPVAIAQAVSVLGLKQEIYDGAPIRVLKWDRRTASYQPYLIGD